MTKTLRRMRTTLRTTGYFLLEPRTFAYALVWFYIVISILQWLFQMDLLVNVWQNSALDFWDKVDFMIDAFRAVFTTGLDIVPVAFTVIALAMSASILMTLHIRKHLSSRSLSQSIVLGLLGSGCVACGGSILTPALSFFASGGSVAASGAVQTLGDILLVLAAVLSVRGLVLTAEEYARVVSGNEISPK